MYKPPKWGFTHNFEVISSHPRHAVAKYLVASAPRWGFWSPWDLARRPGRQRFRKTLDQNAAFARKTMGKPWYFTTEKLDLA